MSLADYYILENHEPRTATWEEYAAWLRQGFDETRRVANDTVGEAGVSTVFLTIDHGWGAGPPILFESMIFGGPHDGDQWRYSSWDEAKTGHDRIVAALKAGLDPDDGRGRQDGEGVAG